MPDDLQLRHINDIVINLPSSATVPTAITNIF